MLSLVLLAIALLAILAYFVRRVGTGKPNPAHGAPPAWLVVVLGFGDATTGRVIEPVPDYLIEVRAGYILAFGPQHIIAIDDPPV